MTALDDLTVEVRELLPACPQRVWELIVDVERMAGLGPEHAEARWRGTAGGPGAWFDGVNERGDRRWEVPCRVLTWTPTTAFGFEVGDPASPSARWDYTLAPSGQDRTAVTQRFRPGPGFSLLRVAADRQPQPGQCAKCRVPVV